MGGARTGLPGFLESVILISVPKLPHALNLPMPGATYTVCLVDVVHHFGDVIPLFLLQQHRDTNTVHEPVQLLLVGSFENFFDFLYFRRRDPGGRR